jgi:hypothetical protein
MNEIKKNSFFKKNFDLIFSLFMLIIIFIFTFLFFLNKISIVEYLSYSVVFILIIGVLGIFGKLISISNDNKKISYDDVYKKNIFFENIFDKFENIRLDEIKKEEKKDNVWDQANEKLNIYIDKNIAQNSSIFQISVVILIIGFLFILVAIVFAFINPNNLSNTFLISGLGIVNEIIGATFLKLYNDTLNQSSQHTKTLERLTTVGAALEILETLPEADDDSLKNKTKAEVVKMLMDNVSKEIGNE